VREVTRILSAIEHGEARAAEHLLPLVYDELRQLAARRMAREAPGQTLQPTALVHGAWLRLVDVEQARHWHSRAHFFAAAAEAMRRILVEASRAKRALRRGGERRRHDVHEIDPAAPAEDDDLLALDEALDKLASVDPVKAELVKLRYFAGLSMEDTAAALQISPATAHRYWSYARAWLHREMVGPDDPATPS
jgi:RNA polymerase sigma factor (TIGR02999 family)